MNTDRELMQQALDALEWPKGKWPDLYKRTCNATITALRERLAQPVDRCEDCGMKYCECGERK